MFDGNLLTIRFLQVWVSFLGKLCLLFNAELHVKSDGHQMKPSNYEIDS